MYHQPRSSRAGRESWGPPPEERVGQGDTRITAGVSTDLYEGGAQILDSSRCRNIQWSLDAHQLIMPPALRGHLFNALQEELDSFACDLVLDASGPAKAYAGTYGDAIVVLDAGTTGTLDHTADCEAQGSNAGLSAATAVRQVGVRT